MTFIEKYMNNNVTNLIIWNIYYDRLWFFDPAIAQQQHSCNEDVCMVINRYKWANPEKQTFSLNISLFFNDFTDFLIESCVFKYDLRNDHGSNSISNFDMTTIEWFSYSHW